MKKNIYQVTAIIKANCTEYKYVVDVSADSRKEAIKTARGMWNKVSHLFHVKARRLEAHEEALYGFWKEYEEEPQTKSKPEEAHVDIDKMTCETKSAPEPAAPQEAANETEADATEAPDEYAEARKLRARAYGLRLRAENLNNEGKLHDDFVRYVEKLELQASEAVSRAYVAKNPRLAAVLEKAKAKQAEHAATEQEAALIQETRLGIATFYEKYVKEYGFCKDSGDNVAGFDEAVKAFSAFIESDANAAFVREFCAHMGDYIASDREAAAFMFALESMTAPSMCETEPEEPDEQAAMETADEPAPEFNYDFLSGCYGIFKHEGGTFSNEYETDDLKEARDYLKEETEGTVKRVDYAIFDRDARQYIQIHATAKGRKVFKAENERLAVKTATPVNQKESDSAEAGQPALQAGMTDEERINALFRELVPVEGKADTVAGEIVRAVCRIGYRHNNDGDYVGSGYGKETCNPAARYLMANAGENIAEIVRCLWKAGEECGILDDGSYGDWLSELVRAALVYLDEHPELKTTPNAVGYWDYHDPNEDVDEWDDEDEDEWGAA